MEEQQIQQALKPKNPIVGIILSIIITAMVVGGIFYYWQLIVTQELRSQVNELNESVSMLQSDDKKNPGLMPTENKEITKVNENVTKEVAFASFNDSGWSGGWLLLKNSDTDKWEKEIKLTNKYIVGSGVIDNTSVYVSLSGNLNDPDAWSRGIMKINLLTNETSYQKMDGYVTNLLKTQDGILAYQLIDGCGVDAPNTVNDSCKANIYVNESDGSSKNLFSVPEKFKDIPGSKSLVAYNPNKETFILRDGYGDGPCLRTDYYEYNLGNSRLDKVFSSSGCGEVEIEKYKAEVNTFKNKIIDEYSYNIYNEKVTEVIKLDDGVLSSGGEMNNPPEKSHITTVYLD